MAKPPLVTYIMDLGGDGDSKDFETYVFDADLLEDAIWEWIVKKIGTDRRNAELLVTCIPTPAVITSVDITNTEGQ